MDDENSGGSIGTVSPRNDSSRNASSQTATEGGEAAKEPSPARLVAVVSFFVLASAAIFLAVRLVTDEPLGLLRLLASLGGGLLAALLIGSVGEWFVHRYIMHRRLGSWALGLPYDLHHRAHHWIQYRPDEYVHEDRVQRVPVAGGRLHRVCTTRAGRVLTVVSHVAFYSFFAVVLGVLPALAFTGNLLFTGVVSVALGIEIYLFVRVHDAVHHPGLSRLERYRWFRFLDRHHYIHHIDNKANTNFLLPLCDLLTGTLRRELSARELATWPSYEEARRNIAHPAFDENGVRVRTEHEAARKGSHQEAAGR